ncbi:hypothetical protein GGS21DRAFT_492267 [Xylaria nigripes]|nr:hypothetical protein GGS21DRAFT_492267 [Xylaria nigripes]
MPGQIVAPVPVSPNKSSVQTGSDLFASLNARLSSKNKFTTPVHSIQERDWDVPAPPPPSPSKRDWPTWQSRPGYPATRTEVFCM